MNQQANIEKFFHFVDERQRIWYKRNVLELHAPWTEDPILQKYHFCNVYREFDKGTIWMQKHVMGEPKDRFFQIVQYRYINSIRFFEEHPLLNIGNYRQHAPEELKQTMKQRRSEGKPIFGAAYTVYKTFNNATGLPDTIESYIKIIHLLFLHPDEIWAGVEDSENAEKAFEAIRDNIIGCGPFMAYEIWCDLVLLGLLPYTENDFVNVGPGARVGLEAIFGENITAYEALLYWLKDNQENLLPRDFPGKRLTLRSVEHSLCEYAKYCKYSLGKGKIRIFQT